MTTEIECRNSGQEKRLIGLFGGRRGIRTPGAVNPAVFKTAAIDHSAILPRLVYHKLITFGRGNTKMIISSVYF
jgi:hypothetical protein